MAGVRVPYRRWLDEWRRAFSCKSPAVLKRVARHDEIGDRIFLTALLGGGVGALMAFPEPLDGLMLAAGCVKKLAAAFHLLPGRFEPDGQPPAAFALELRGIQENHLIAPARATRSFRRDRLLVAFQFGAGLVEFEFGAEPRVDRLVEKLLRLRLLAGAHLQDGIEAEYEWLHG